MVDNEPLLQPSFHRLEQLYRNRDFFNFVFMESHKELGKAWLLHCPLGIPDVMCHGDLWAYNILWKRDHYGRTLNEVEALVDWQNVHPGSCGRDLARLLCICLDSDVRQQQKAQLADPSRHGE